MKDNNDGTYSVEYFPRNKTNGYYKVKVLTRLGEVIRNGPFTVAVGKFLDVSKAEVKFDKREVFVGETCTFEIVLRDQNGDPLAELPKDFKIEVGGVEVLATGMCLGCYLLLINNRHQEILRRSLASQFHS